MKNTERAPCAISQPKATVGPERVVTVPEFQKAFMEAKNKGQMNRACIRTLTTLGYTANGTPEFYKKIKPFRDDWSE